MKSISFTGECPQCELYEEYYLMQDNGKFWECPSCSLQILIEGKYASILRHRGNHQFKFNFKEFKGNFPYQEVDLDSYPNGKQIVIKPQLIEYLLKKVLQKPYYSIDNLIDTYILYKLKIGSKTRYQEQASHFNVDFENIEILEILRKRDQLKDFSKEYENFHLYSFLVDDVLPIYGSNKLEELFDIEMNKLEIHLCNKHFPAKNLEQLKVDKAFSKQALKNLAKDIIEIIYFEGKIFLTGNLELGKEIKKEMYLK